YRPNQPYERNPSDRQDRYTRPGGGYDGYNRSRIPVYPQEPQRFAENRRPQEGIRNYPDPRTGYGRPQPEAYNRIQPPRNTFNSPPAYGRPAPTYGSGFYNKPESGR